MPTKVLIVDDSALVRKLLTKLINADPALKVVGTAPDPIVAREKIKKLDPDVLTLDIEMPRQDGLTFLSTLMRLRPMPVIMVSTLTDKGAATTLRALDMGAVDFVSKPKIDVARELEGYGEELCRKLKAAARARIRPRLVLPGVNPPARLDAGAVIEKRWRGHFRTTDRILAIGASTGGTEAIRDLLARLPADGPPTVIAQHIPAAFSGPFAARLDKHSAMAVAEARHGQELRPGHAYVAPGDAHLLVSRNGARYVCELSDGPPVNRHRPSVDVLFRSVAQSAGPNAIGVLLTGMGRDGAVGLGELREIGGFTIAQDESSSVVWGMPGEAVKLGAACAVLPLDRVASRVLSEAA